MQILTPEDHKRLQAELIPGEHLLWSGKPNPSVIFRSSDWAAIPGGLAITGFMLFWESGVTDKFHFEKLNAITAFMAFWGGLGLIYSQYILWGRFLYAAWKKRHILYAVTNLRALVLVTPPRAKLIATFLGNIPTIEKILRPDGIGTLAFGTPPPLVVASRQQKTAAIDGLHLTSGIPVFVDIDDAQTVYSLITDLRARANRTTQH